MGILGALRSLVKGAKVLEILGSNAIIKIYKAIEIESLKKSTRAFLYAMRALAKEDAGDMKGACSDAKKSKSIYFDPRDRVLTERVCKRFWEQ